MEIVLDNEDMISVTRTNDALKAFETAVDNGQTRLAMDILLPIIKHITSILDETQSKEIEPQKNDAPPVKKTVAKKAAASEKEDEVSDS
jgi:hypothetical protein